MHYFIGNKFTGSWSASANGQIIGHWEPDYVSTGKEFIWKRTHDSGDFYWPHLIHKGKEVELVYHDITTDGD